jgi:hypothetical protein
LTSGAHVIQRNDGKYLIFHGGLITDIYDPISNGITTGPLVNATNTLASGAHSLRKNDGRTVTYGTGAIASYYDQDSNTFQVGAGVGNIGNGGNGYQLPNGDWLDYRGWHG